MLLQVRLVGLDPLLTHVGRVADDHVEAAGGEGGGEGRPPELQRRRVADDAVAADDVGVEGREHLADLGRLDPRRQPGDFDGLAVEVHAEDVVGQDGFARLEQPRRRPQCGQDALGLLVLGKHLVEGFDEERAAAAGGIDDADGFEFFKPAGPELGEGGAVRRGLLGRAEVVGIGEELRILLSRGDEALAIALEAVADDGPQGLGEDVTGHERRGVERPLFLALRRLARLDGRHPGDRGDDGAVHLFEVGNALLEDVAEDFHVDELADAVGGVAVVVLGEFLEALADLVGHTQGVEEVVLGVQPAVVLPDVEVFVAAIDGVEQADEVPPDRPRVVGVGVPVGAGDAVRGQQPAVLAEGDEQDAVEDFLRRRE